MGPYGTLAVMLAMRHWNPASFQFEWPNFCEESQLPPFLNSFQGSGTMNAIWLYECHAFFAFTGSIFMGTRRLWFLNISHVLFLFPGWDVWVGNSWWDMCIHLPLRLASQWHLIIAPVLQPCCTWWHIHRSNQHGFIVLKQQQGPFGFYDRRLVQHPCAVSAKCVLAFWLDII